MNLTDFDVVCYNLVMITDGSKLKREKNICKMLKKKLGDYVEKIYKNFKKEDDKFRY